MRELAAQNWTSIFGTINFPISISINGFINAIIQLIYTFAALAFLAMVIWSALSLITSGGDKEAVGKARARLTFAIIGLALLALAFMVTTVVFELLSFPKPF